VIRHGNLDDGNATPRKKSGKLVVSRPRIPMMKNHQRMIKRSTLGYLRPNGIVFLNVGRDIRGKFEPFILPLKPLVASIRSFEERLIGLSLFRKEAEFLDAPNLVGSGKGELRVEREGGRVLPFLSPPRTPLIPSI